MKTIDCLIVEDSPTQAMQLEQLLTENSFSVEVARNGLEALASLDQCTPLVVISDVVMPVMDGYEVCRRIKASPKHKGILVMLLTSVSEAEDIFRALECGADNFVTKPAAPEQLLSRLNYLMANCKVRDEEQMSAGLEVSFGGERQFITSSRLHILNLLLTTYDVAVQKNKELIDASEALHRLNADLERQVEDRTQQMLAEIEQRKAMEVTCSTSRAMDAKPVQRVRGCE